MSTKRVIVVGSGVSGSAAALRVRELLGDAVEITVLEAGETVGGRAQRTSFAGEEVEIGGTLLHSTNGLVVDLMKRLGLKRAERAAEGGLDSGIGIWDGTRFVLRLRTGRWGFLAAVIARYRLPSLRRLGVAAREALGRFERLYALLDGRRFRTPAELAEAAGFAELSRLSITDALLGQGVSQRAIDEIGGGVLRNMYNQSPTIAAFPGFVGLIGAGLAGGELFSIAGGNNQLAEGSLRLAGAEVRTGCRVVEVRDDRTVVLEDGSELTADVVVLAVPLAVAGITLPSAVELPPTRYRRVNVTLVAGTPSATYFGTPKPPNTIFTVADSPTPFNSIGTVGWSRSEQVPILKFFSLEELPDALVGDLVDDVRAVKRHEWDAYPIMEVNPQSAPFELAPGIFFPNALEVYMSTLETETIAGRVVGDLVADRLSA